MHPPPAPTSPAAAHIRSTDPCLSLPLQPPYRIKVLYALSSIVRLSHTKRGSHDKYCTRIEPLLDPDLASLLAQSPPENWPRISRVRWGCMPVWGVLGKADAYHSFIKPLHAS